jgi:hypothetical protein
VVASVVLITMSFCEIVFSIRIVAIEVVVYKAERVTGVAEVRGRVELKRVGRCIIMNEMLRTHLCNQVTKVNGSMSSQPNDSDVIYVITETK